MNNHTKGQTAEMQGETAMVAGSGAGSSGGFNTEFKIQTITEVKRKWIEDLSLSQGVLLYYSSLLHLLIVD